MWQLPLLCRECQWEETQGLRQLMLRQTYIGLQHSGSLRKIEFKNQHHRPKWIQSCLEIVFKSTWPAELCIIRTWKWISFQNILCCLIDLVQASVWTVFAATVIKLWSNDFKNIFDTVNGGTLNTLFHHWMNTVQIKHPLEMTPSKDNSIKPQRNRSIDNEDDKDA